MLPACRQTAIPACGVKEWGMTQMPLVAAIALIVTAVLFVVGIITLIVGFATHRVSMESPLADDDDNDDLSDDTATLLSMLPGASVVVDEHDEVVRCNPAAYRLGVVSDDAIAQQHVLDAIHEARKSGGKRQFDLTTDTRSGTSQTRTRAITSPRSPSTAPTG